MVSASNVAEMFGDNNAFPNSEIDSSGSNFNFFSAYLTGSFNSNLNIEVEGFDGTNLLYNTTVVASAMNATLFTFNYLNIDRLYFNSFGGQPAFGLQGADEDFTMDNFDFEFVPEPSSLLLTASPRCSSGRSSSASAGSVNCITTNRPTHLLDAENLFQSRGSGVPVAKSAALSFVSVAPPSPRRSAVVFDGAGAGPAPS